MLCQKINWLGEIKNLAEKTKINNVVVTFLSSRNKKKVVLP